MALRFDISLSHRLPSLPSSSKSNSSPLFPSIPMPSRSVRRRIQGKTLLVCEKVFLFCLFPTSASGVEIGFNRGWKCSRISCIVQGEGTAAREVVKEKSVSVVLLAGGKGKRMGASMPKQYLPLLGQPIALYSFFTFSQMSEVKEIVVVCDPSYRDVFEDASKDIRVGIKFALPGKERQDSVFNGFQEIDGSSELVCVHDSARPLITPKDVTKVMQDAWTNGAAVLGVPVKATIKEADNDSFVVKTLDRKTLWEMQTPQVIKPDLFRAGFELVNRYTNLVLMHIS
ncbi:hypothetical protein ZIOFF_004390 [Zingiber officinale]|uniref:2-C-methyl-D-erythritol 4-phosphate cytidylyltransferase, chloroplastic n=1 Tax=Zingiber officinale TaxID=94328 RepID=A0A8J5MB78_ZINOF|nr:hypothetical protein ZIOFF_004390 [Zingiber officinale]